MIQWELSESYPNISICLRILFCIPVAVACGERRFSNLNLIKNNLRSSMNQERLISNNF